MKRIILVFVLLATIFLIGCATETMEEKETMEKDEGMIEDEETVEETGFVDVATAKAKELIDNNPDLIVIDVSPHYDNVHLPRVSNYYLCDGSLDQASPSSDQTAEFLGHFHVESVAIAGAQNV